MQSDSLSERELQQRASLRVLVVDDMSSMRMLLKAMLKQLGMPHVTEAEDGLQAIDHLSRAPVDFLVCDWNMPGATGLDVLVHVRQTMARPDLPFMMVTAEQGREHRVKATEAGVTSYLVKPFAVATFKEHVDSCLVALPKP